MADLRLPVKVEKPLPTTEWRILTKDSILICKCFSKDMLHFIVPCINERQALITLIKQLYHDRIYSWKRHDVEDQIKKLFPDFDWAEYHHRVIERAREEKKE